MHGQRRPRGASACTPLGPTCRLTSFAPCRARRPRRPASCPATWSIGVDGASLDGLTARRGGREGPRAPEGTPVTLSIVARRRAGAVDVDDRPRLIRAAGGPDEGPRRRRRRLREARRLQRSASAGDFAAARRPTSRAAGRDARSCVDIRGNRRRVRDGRARHREPVHRVRARSTGRRTRRGDQRRRRREARRRARPDPDVRVAVLVDGGQRLGERDRRRRAPGHRAGHARREQAFGKGTIQEWLPLPNDTGGMRLTVAKWLTPAKRWIHGTGIDARRDVDAGPRGRGLGRRRRGDRPRARGARRDRRGRRRARPLP